MDAAEVIYRNQEGVTEAISTGESVPGNRDLTVDSIEVDEEGEWVMVEAVNHSTGAEGGIMIPKGRVVRINEGAARNR